MAVMGIGDEGCGEPIPSDSSDSDDENDRSGRADEGGGEAMRVSHSQASKARGWK